MKISRDQWLQVEPLLNAALDLPDVGRDQWLNQLDTDQPAVSPLVRKLLATHDRAERLQQLETVPALAAPWSSAFAAGTVVGPYRLLRPIGRGGMGEVWLAEQIDGRIERRVALKLPSAYQLSTVWRERFRRERDILAKLNHPHIAQLYDAGVSEADGSRGQPYLAMEYVEGESLTDYVAAQKLPLAARLRLFRQVLEAVGHAHRHLVVHRDLKPANILIDRGGQVKLLDFGIAKLIDDDDDPAADLTRIGGRMMTLRYAAPEQVADGAISTATDVYALGVILHELLTGLSPYRLVRDGKMLTDSGLLAEQVSVPSSLPFNSTAAAERGLAAPAMLARALAGDLDAVLLKALRRDPAARYATIEQFDDDILRHLAHRPVSARDGTWRYLAGRFMARHKLPIAAATAVVLTMLAGLVMVEQQRRQAVAQRERAEKHFASVRQLANTFMFDVHSEIEPLAGSLKARQILVGTALKYLDSLAGEAGTDADLALEVAVAYRKLAEIKGDFRSANLGEAGNARRNAERAAELLDKVAAREPGNIRLLRERRVLALLIGRMKLEAGDAAGIAETERAVGLAERIVSLPGAELNDRRSLGATLAEYGGILAVVKDDQPAAAMQLGRAIDILETLVRQAPADLVARSRLAYAYERAAISAELTREAAQLPQAIVWLEKSIAATEALARDEPDNNLHSQVLAKRYNNVARVKMKVDAIDGPGGARDYANRAQALIERLVRSDTGNVGDASALAGVLATASSIENAAGQPVRAAALARQAIAADARLPAETRSGLIVRENLAEAWRALGVSQCALANRADAQSTQRRELVSAALALLAQARAFKQELVERKIDAREAAGAMEAIDAEMQQCGAQQIAGPKAAQLAQTRR